MLQRFREFLTPQVVFLLLVVGAVTATAWAGGRWFTTHRIDARLDTVVARISPPEESGSGSDTADDAEADASASEPTEPAADVTGEAVVQRVLNRYIFNQRPPQRFRQIRGVLGNAVLFREGGAVEVGGTFDGAKVIEVGGDWVKLEFEGEEIVVGVSGGRGGYGQRNRRNRPQRNDAPPQTAVATPTDDTPPAPSPGRGRITFADLDPAKIAAKFGIPLSVVQQEMSNASDSDLQQLIDHLGDDIDSILKD